MIEFTKCTSRPLATMSIVQPQQQRHNQIRECCQGSPRPSGPTSQSLSSACHTHIHAQKTICRDQCRRTYRSIARCSRSSNNISNSIHTFRPQPRYQRPDLFRGTAPSPHGHRRETVRVLLLRQSLKERRKGTLLQLAFHARKRISGKSYNCAPFPTLAEKLLMRNRCDGTYFLFDRGPGMIGVRAR